jgi:hypothetical protein
MPSLIVDEETGENIKIKAGGAGSLTRKIPK